VCRLGPRLHLVPLLLVPLHVAVQVIQGGVGTQEHIVTRSRAQPSQHLVADERHHLGNPQLLKELVEELGHGEAAADRLPAEVAEPHETVPAGRHPGAVVKAQRRDMQEDRAPVRRAGPLRDGKATLPVPQVEQLRVEIRPGALAEALDRL
jgi:hypothetical protein